MELSYKILQKTTFEGLWLFTETKATTKLYPKQIFHIEFWVICFAAYVATRFPMVEISRIKQVLAYKCKENSTAFKMKAVRYYGYVYVLKMSYCYNFICFSVIKWVNKAMKGTDEKQK